MRSVNFENVSLRKMQICSKLTNLFIFYLFTLCLMLANNKVDTKMIPSYTEQ